MSENFEFDSLECASNYRDVICERFKKYLIGDLLEIGAGIGQMTSVLQKIDTVKSITSIEPNGQFFLQLKSTNPMSKFGTVDVVKNNTYDSIISINVLEHIEDDILELKQYSQILSPNGFLCLFVPARKEIFSPLDKIFGHYRRYSKEELNTKLISSGFEVVELKYFNIIGYFLWWFNFCLLKKKYFDKKLVGLFDKFIFPITNRLESHIFNSPFIGQSLMVVCKTKQ